jgi:hypothetical protein
MSNAYAYRETEAERERVAAWFKQAGLTPPKPAGATVTPIGAKRKPLTFLEPIVEDNDGDGDKYLGPQATAEKIVASSLALLTPEAQAKPATMGDLWVYGIGTAIEFAFGEGDELRKRFKELRAEIADLKGARREEAAELRATVAELRSELSQMRSIQESARILSRGEQGLQGPRGVPGSQGPAGPRGEQGERGAPAAMIAAYEPRVEQFQLVPVYTTGERGVPMSLRPFFDSYDAATSPDDEG